MVRIGQSTTYIKGPTSTRIAHAKTLVEMNQMRGNMGGYEKNILKISDLHAARLGYNVLFLDFDPQIKQVSQGFY